MKKYSTDQLWDLYEELPKPLQQTIFSPEVAEDILAICQKNGIKEDENIAQVAEMVGYVLLGLLSPANLEKELQKTIGIKKTTAKNITQEITESVFLKVKEFLEKIYNTKLSLNEKTTTSQKNQNKKTSNKAKTSKKDIYREPIE